MLNIETEAQEAMQDTFYPNLAARRTEYDPASFLAA